MELLEEVAALAHAWGRGFLQGSDRLGQTGKPEGYVLGKKGTHSGNSYERVSILGVSSTLCTGDLDLCPRVAISWYLKPSNLNNRNLFSQL